MENILTGKSALHIFLIPRKECKMKHVKWLLICLITVSLFCAGCKKDESSPEEPNAQVKSTQAEAAT
jgi:hypothetical protein